MPRAPRRPRTRRRIALIAAASLATILLAGFLLIYFVLFPTSSPKPFKLSLAPASATPATSTGAASTSTAASGRLAGQWRVAGGSQAGYRVREQLAFLPAQSDAVGRTSQIAGAATFTESKGIVTVSGASFSVAVNTLKSDRSMRDEKIHSIGLESDTYPTATFVLSAPITLGADALARGVAHVEASGTLSLHGVSKQVSIPFEMGLSGATVEAAGSLTFPWGEFNMTAPTIGGFVTVTEKATMEFDLRLQRA
jgi:polyisoprenoid-binding protein YceI